MAKRKSPTEKCYMCIESGTTREHVPPYSFFPEGCRTNLITVPSCPKHNNHNSKDVEYVRNIIASSIQINETGLSLGDKVIRSYTRSPALVRRTFKKMRVVKVDNEEIGLTVIDIPRFNVVMEAIAHGLYYRDFGTTYPGKWRIIHLSLETERTFDGLPDQQARFLKFGFSRLETVGIDTNYPEVFKYGIYQESLERIVYKFMFYGDFTVCAMGITKDSQFSTLQAK